GKDPLIMHLSVHPVSVSASLSSCLKTIRNWNEGSHQRFVARAFLSWPAFFPRFLFVIGKHEQDPWSTTVSGLGDYPRTAARHPVKSSEILFRSPRCAEEAEVKAQHE